MCHELVVKADAIADNILWKVQTKQTVETRTVNMTYGSKVRNIQTSETMTHTHTPQQITT